jgi:hypothetical protein
VPFSRLHVPDIKAEVISRGMVASISDMTIWRWLDEDAIKPWTHRSWIFLRDPDFEPKGARVLDLYAREFEGCTLQPDEYVISADEKPSIQARVRCHPTVAPTLATRCSWSTSTSAAVLWPTLRLGTSTAPSSSGAWSRAPASSPLTGSWAKSWARSPIAPRVFWVLDNGSSHRGAASVRRLQKAHPNLMLVHLPIHASWLNQVEIYFSILQRKVLTPPDANSLEDLAARILGFQAYYEMMAKPFEWKFTRADLAKLLARLGLRELASRQNAA